MATTSKGIYYPVTGDVLTPLESQFASMATSINTALGNITETASYTGTNAQRTALASPKLREGVTFYTTDTNFLWFYNGSSWKVIPSRPIIARVNKNIAQTMASAQTITWSTSDAPIDTDGFYNTGQTTRLTLPVSGLYRVTYTLNSSSAGAKGYGNVWRNGSEYAVGKAAGQGTTGKGMHLHDAIIGSFSSGDYLEIRVSITDPSGAWAASSGECTFSAEYLGQV